MEASRALNANQNLRAHRSGIGAASKPVELAADFWRNAPVQDWAAIFDWDGVVIDSSAQHELAWEKLAGELQRVLPPGFFRRSFGMKNERVIPELLGWTRVPAEVRQLSLRKEAIYREILARDGARPLPGVARLLQQLREARVPIAIASSTPRLNIDAVIDGLGFRGAVDAIITGEDVTLGKPHPEVFLLAAAKLGAQPERCVVFEDAHVGIEAALAAGMKVVAVATTHPAESLKDAHRVLRTLEDLQVAEVAAWFGAAPR